MLKDGLYTAEEDINEVLGDGRVIQVLAKGASVSEIEARRLGLIKSDQPVGPSEFKAEQAGAPLVETPAQLTTGEVASDSVLAIGSNATNPRARRRLSGS